tara:strand:+ start:1022 stop:1588 length:567 start_codon:yes stop_codon:yes gene_type:complete
MNFKILNQNYSKDELIELSQLHKNILADSIATNMSKNSLSKLYELFINNEILKVANVYDDDNLLGSVSIVINKFPTFKFSREYLQIFYYLASSYIRRPFNTLAESVYKYFAYRNVTSDINIIFLFVDEEYRNKNLGSRLIDFVLTDVKGVVTVDTNISNKKGIKFYKKNNFKISKTTEKKVVLSRDQN